jgi:tRNA U55 pseudouridine synthase TruB
MSTLLLSKPSEVPYGELIPTQIISTAYEELYSKKKRENEEFLRLLKKGLDEKYSKGEARTDLLRLDADKIIYQSDGTIERMTQVPQYKRENDVETFVIEKFVDLPSNFIGDYLTNVMKKVNKEDLEMELEKKQEYENLKNLQRKSAALIIGKHAIPCELVIRWARSRDSRTLVGFSFKNIDSLDHQLIQAFIFEQNLPT